MTRRASFPPFVPPPRQFFPPAASGINAFSPEMHADSPLSQADAGCRPSSRIDLARPRSVPGMLGVPLSRERNSPHAPYRLISNGMFDRTMTLLRSFMPAPPLSPQYAAPSAFSFLPLCLLSDDHARYRCFFPASDWIFLPGKCRRLRFSFTPLLLWHFPFWRMQMTPLFPCGSKGPMPLLSGNDVAYPFILPLSYFSRDQVEK